MCSISIRVQHIKLHKGKHSLCMDFIGLVTQILYEIHSIEFLNSFSKKAVKKIFNEKTVISK